jgi:hypothetical protein
LSAKKYFRSKEWKPVLALTAVFIVSRIAFHFAGVVFYGEFIKRLWQAIDVELLKDSLFENLYYSHAQPPLFNLLSGVVLKFFPNHYAQVFHILFLLVGWLNAIILYLSLRKFNFSQAAGFSITSIFMLLPCVVLYENLYSYSYLVVFLLTFAVYLLIVFVKEEKPKYWVAFYSVLAALVLLRSFYHIFWMIAIAAIVIYFLKKEKKLRVKLFYGLVPMVFVFIWLLKNFFVFGIFSTSSWMGMNMARIMPPATALGKTGPFKPIDQYVVNNPCRDYPDVKLLHEVHKTNSGFVNYYHIDYIHVSDEFSKEVIREIQKHPAAYLTRVSDAFVIYFNPVCHAPFIDKNYNHIGNYAAVANLDFTGYNKFEKDHFPVSQAIIMIALHIALILGVIYCYQKNIFTVDDKVIVAVMIFMLMYGILIGNFFEYGENNRFRFEQLTVFVLLGARVASRIFRRSAFIDYSSEAI